MKTAADKVTAVCQWTALLVCLVLCLQGHPPARGQDGTSSANTVQGLYLKEAITEQNMAQARAEGNANTLAIQAQDTRLREVEKAIASIDAKSTIFDPFIVALMIGNMSLTAWKKKKSEA